MILISHQGNIEKTSCAKSVLRESEEGTRVENNTMNYVVLSSLGPRVNGYEYDHKH